MTKKKFRTLAMIFLALIIVFSFCAQLIITRGYTITVQHVTLEVRGADLTMDIYRPSKVTADTKLPCMILSHGGSECLSVDSLHAWEYARRGYVVLNVNMYGAGTADMPDYFEDGKPYNRNQGTSGLYDALQYARSISYVDSTRIGMWGHSQSYSIYGPVLVLDGALLSLNDRMFNALHDEFGLEITAEQLALNADDVAAENLSEDQMKEYEYIKAEQQKIVDNYVVAARVFDNNCCLMKTTVAGIEVTRTVHTNLQIGGERNGTSATSATRFTQPSERYKQIFCVDGAMERNSYYAIPDTVADPEARSTMLGTAFQDSVATNEELREAFENRSIFFTYNPSTHHNGNLWSHEAVSTTMEFFTQALRYNNGDLDDPNTQPISTKDMMGSCIAIILTTLATFSLLGFLCALAGVLLYKDSFEGLAVPAYQPRLKIKSLDFLLVTVIAIITTFVAAKFGSDENLGMKTSNAVMSKFLPTEPGHTRLWWMIATTAACGAVLFAIFALIKHFTKGKSTVAKVSDLHIGIGCKNVFKTLWLSVILFIAAYILTAFVMGAFDGRFQFVDGSLELMKPYSFVRMIKYFVVLLPFTFVISGLNNLTIVDGVSDGVDTAISVVVNSLGTWLFIGIASIVTFSTTDHMTFWGLHTMLPAICLVPMCNYLYRRLYKNTGSIWAGAFFVALFIAWRLAGYVSHRFMFWGYDSVITRFFGF